MRFGSRRSRNIANLSSTRHWRKRSTLLSIGASRKAARLPTSRLARVCGKALKALVKRAINRQPFLGEALLVRFTSGVGQPCPFLLGNGSRQRLHLSGE